MNFRNKIRDHKAQSQGKEYSLLENSAVNIAFTQSGLNLVSTFVLEIEILLKLDLSQFIARAYG